MSDYGELIDETTVRFVRLLPGPIERIWDYITVGEKRKRWLCGGETATKPGGRVTMEFHNATLSSQPDDDPPEKYAGMSDPMTFGGTVTEYEPPKRLSHTWDFENDHSEVTYELETVGEQVRLTLTHRKIGSAEEMASACGGWHTHLDILVDVLEGDEPRAFWKTHTPLEAHYREQLGI